MNTHALATALLEAPDRPLVVLDSAGRATVPNCICLGTTLAGEDATVVVAALVVDTPRDMRDPVFIEDPGLQPMA